MEVYHNHTAPKEKKSYERMIAINPFWKSVLTLKGLEIRRISDGKKLRLSDMNYPKMVEVVMDLVEDDERERLENLVEEYVELLDILEQSKDYIKDKTFANVKEDITDVLSLVDEGNEWTE